MGLQKKKNIHLIFEQIAISEGVSVADIRREMMISIEDARNNPDPNVQAEFTKLFGNATPTPEEFVLKASAKLRRWGY